MLNAPYGDLHTWDLIQIIWFHTNSNLIRMKLCSRSHLKLNPDQIWVHTYSNLNRIKLCSLKNSIQINLILIEWTQRHADQLDPDQVSPSENTIWPGSRVSEILS